MAQASKHSHHSTKSTTGTDADIKQTRRLETDERIRIPFLLNGDDKKCGNSSLQCDECHKVFTQKADVRKHKKTVHEKARDYHCSECRLSFGERGNLNKHVRSVHRKERNFQCHVCDAAFPFRNGLTEHIRIKHSDDRPFPCSICSSAFKKKSHCIRHMELVHSRKAGKASANPVAGNGDWQ